MIRFELSTSYRYRGYRYDTETGFYYLQSRYYDPEIGRFINADVYIDTGDTVLSTNMFAYCENDAINGYDPSGEYNRNKAIAYASRWWDARNPRYKSNGARKDCANFVSQCLFAGGFSKMTKTWYNHGVTIPGKYTVGDISKEWGTVNGLKNWLTRSKKVARIGVYSFKNFKNILKLSFKPGDVLFFSKDCGKTWYHAAIIGTKLSVDAWYYAHSNNRDGSKRNENSIHSFLKNNNHRVCILEIR